MAPLTRFDIFTKLLFHSHTTHCTPPSDALNSGNTFTFGATKAPDPTTSGYLLNHSRWPHRVISGGDIRLIFKIYLIVASAAFTILGGYCVKFFARNQLLKGKALSLTSTVGWTQGLSLGKLILEIRRMPGGIVGFLMILYTCLNLVADLGVAQAVTSVTGTYRQSISQGLVMDDAQLYNAFPDSFNGAYILAATAQSNSYTNAEVTGLEEPSYGIYRLVPNDFDSYFMATEEDVLGSWVCSLTTPEPILYNQSYATTDGNSSNIYDETIFLDLVQRGLLYSVAGHGFVATNVTGKVSGDSPTAAAHSFAMTASNYTTGSNWDLAFAVDVQDVNYPSGVKYIDTFKCTLQSADDAKTVEAIQRSINVVGAMNGYVEIISGSLWPSTFSTTAYSTAGIETNLEYYLNSMIMVSGCGQYVDINNINNYTYGTYGFATVIPYWVIVICVLIAVSCLALAVFMICLYVSNRKLCREYDSKRQDKGLHVNSTEIMENTPVGLLPWIRHAAYESRDVDHVPESKELQGYILSTTWHGNRRLGIVRKDELGHTNPAHAAGGAQQHLLKGYPEKSALVVDKNPSVSSRSTEVV